MGAALALGSAATIPMFSTGAGIPGGDDPHWTVTSALGTAPAKILSLSNVWFAWGPDNDGLNSLWIAPVDSFSQPQAPYTYSQTFDLTGFDPSTATISGIWSVDDVGTMFLNGNQMGVTQTD